MSVIKNKIRIANYFLPRGASIVTLDHYYKEPAILEGDLDEDGEIELIVLYKRDGKYYVMGLKRELGRWESIWNRLVRYMAVDYFKLVHLENPNRLDVAIAGTIGGMEKSQLMVLRWQQDEAVSLLNEYIAFDKLYIQDVDGKDGIDELILWQHYELEAYDIHLYRYEEGEIVEDTSLEVFYYPTVVGYYKYLQEAYPEEKIYTTYLDEALIKARSGTSNQEEKMDFIEGGTAYLEVVGKEEDVFLLGKREEDESCFLKMQLMVTYEDKTKNQLIRLDIDKVYDYQFKIGRFLEGDREQVFIKVNAKTDKARPKCWVIGLEEGHLYNYIQEELYQEEELGEGFIAEKELDGRFTLYSAHNLLSEEGKEEAKYKVRCFKGEKAGFRLYKSFIVVEEGEII